MLWFIPQKHLGYRLYYDEHNAVRPLPRLKEGQRVMTKLDNENLWRDTGIFKSFDPDLRTCIMETPCGTIRRNRRHVKGASSAPTSTLRSPTTADLTDTFVDNPNNSPPMVVENPNCNQASEPIMPQTGIQPTVTRSGRTIVKTARYDDFVSWKWNVKFALPGEMCGVWTVLWIMIFIWYFILP